MIFSLAFSTANMLLMAAAWTETTVLTLELGVVSAVVTLIYISISMGNVARMCDDFYGCDSYGQYQLTRCRSRMG